MISSIIRGNLVSNAVGNNMINDEDDVLQVKNALGTLGDFDAQEPPEPHGIATREMDSAIKSFQKDNGLKIDGIMRPGGETEEAMVSSLASPLSDKRQEPKEKENPDCGQEQIDLQNADARLFIAKNALQRERDKKDALKTELAQEKEKLTNIKTTIAKEGKDSRSAKNKGAATGGVLGSALGAGASRGIGGAMKGASIGMSIGTQAGKILEEAVDIVTGNKTDFSLDRNRVFSINRIQELKNEIAKIAEKIENSLKPAVEDARRDTNKARSILRRCKAGNKR